MKIHEVIVEQEPAVYRSGRASTETPFTTATQAGLTGTQPRPGILRKAASTVGRGAKKAASAVGRGTKQAAMKVGRGLTDLGKAGEKVAKTVVKSPITVPTAIAKKGQRYLDPTSLAYQEKEQQKYKKEQERAASKVVNYALSVYDKALKDANVDPRKEPNRAKNILAQVSAAYFAGSETGQIRQALLNQIKDGIKNLPDKMTRSAAEQFLKQVNQATPASQQSADDTKQDQGFISSLLVPPTRPNTITHTSLPTAQGTATFWYHPVMQRWYQYYGTNWPTDYQTSQQVNDIPTFNALEKQVMDNKLTFTRLAKTKGRRRSQS